MQLSERARMTSEKTISIYRQVSELLTIVKIDREILKRKGEATFLTYQERVRCQELDSIIERLEKIQEELEA